MMVHSYDYIAREYGMISSLYYVILWLHLNYDFKKN